MGRAFPSGIQVAKPIHEGLNRRSVMMKNWYIASLVENEKPVTSKGVLNEI